MNFLQPTAIMSTQIYQCMVSNLCGAQLQCTQSQSIKTMEASRKSNMKWSWEYFEDKVKYSKCSSARYRGLWFVLAKSNASQVQQKLEGSPSYFIIEGEWSLVCWYRIIGEQGQLYHDLELKDETNVSPEWWTKGKVHSRWER